MGALCSAGDFESDQAQAWPPSVLSGFLATSRMGAEVENTGGAQGTREPQTDVLRKDHA
jgi:hypothetical protein